MNSRRFTARCLPCFRQERIAHLSYGRRLLRCGISTRLMTAWGHSRRFRDVGGRVCFDPRKPTSPDQLAMSPKCHEPTYAVQHEYSYSIALSARASSEGGTVRPSALAVLR